VDFDVTKRVLAALEQHGVRYAIVGAVALNTVRLKDKADAYALKERFGLKD